MQILNSVILLPRFELINVQPIFIILLLYMLKTNLYVHLNVTIVKNACVLMFRIA